MRDQQAPAARGGGGTVVWLTGLSGAGKSTLARALAERLSARGIPCHVLDGDVIRSGLNADLGFSPADRAENVRRIAHLAALMADAGLVAIAGLISPYRADRANARQIAERAGHRFVEVYVNTPMAVCEKRDPKGLYARARAGELSDFTGISAPYEPPQAPDLELRPAERGFAAVAEELLRLVLGLRGSSRAV